MNQYNQDLDDFGPELPDSYIYSPESSREEHRESSPRQDRPRPRQDVRQDAPPRRDNNPRQQTQRPRRPQKDIHAKAVRTALVDKRVKMFFGLVLVIVSLLLAVFTFSHLKSGIADQSMAMGSTISQMSESGVQNIGGPVGAKVSYMFITRWFGLGSIAFIIYFGLIGISLLGIYKVKFWATTFQALLIGISTSIILGLVSYTWPTAFSWGGEHGHFVNAFMLETTGVAGAIALSLLLLGTIVIVYFNQISAFYKARKAELEAHRLRRQAAREEYERQKAEAEAELAKSNLAQAAQDRENEESIIEEPSFIAPRMETESAEEEEFTPVTAPETIESQPKAHDFTTLDSLLDSEEPEHTAVNEKVPAEEEIKEIRIDEPEAEDDDNPYTGSFIGIDEDDSDTFAESAEEVPADEAEEVLSENAPQEDDSAGFAIDDIPIQVTVNEIEEADKESELYDPTAELSRYERPPLELLSQRESSKVNVDIEEQEANKQRIIKTLLDYGIPITRIDATVGPTITLFEIVPAEGVRIAAIRRLEDDIARSLAAEGVRIIAPMPGKDTVGIEVPNHVKQTVSMRSVLASKTFQETGFALPMAMGTTISNEVFIEDLTKMPHLLVAGATGQGKSVGLNAIIASLIYKRHPAELKFVLVDPKMVEFSLYSKLERHFLAKIEGEDDAIITDPEKVKATLNSLCLEMDNRYRLLKDAFVRSLEEYNNKFINHRLNPEKGHKFLPYIVVVVDEFADLIMMAGKEIEMPIARIAQKARAVGIHLIIATQRPSTNVITGMIKANFPARIAFRVSAMVDSKTILDRTGANQLIGKGDMLFSWNSKLERVQCAFISTEEVEAMCDWIENQVGYDGAYTLPEYIPEGGDSVSGNNFGDRDSLFEECARFVVASGTASTSSLQRRYSIGYNRAGKIMDQLEAAGIVGAANGGKPRAILVDSLTLERILENN